MELNLRSYAHIGDAVWELYVREIVIFRTLKANELHKMSVKYVNADFQTYLLENLQIILSEEEKNLTRRARNLPTTVKRRNEQSNHRHATAFEVLIGYLYINNKERLKIILDVLREML